MCPVQWRAPSRRPNAVKFISIPPERCAFLLDAPSEYAILALHWSDALKTSVPCMGNEECPHCPGGVKVHVYTIALCYLNSASAWMPMIFDLGHPDADFLQRDLRGRAVWFGREKKGDKRSNVKLLGVNTDARIKAPDPIERIDVRPHLMRRYGLFAEADYFAVHDHAEQQRLAFPVDTEARETA